MAYWLIPAAIGVAGGLQSASQYRSASKAELAESRAQAAEIRRQSIDIAEIATQTHRNRMEQFKELAQYNEAMNAYMGREGRSIKALQQRQQSIYGRDVAQIRLQEAKEKDAVQRQADAVERRGISKSKEYESKARSSLLQTAFNTATIAFPRS